MKCPRCETTTLDERDRDGVTIDLCRQCRGIWLDRGELEKLIARTAREYDDYYEQRSRYQAPPAQKHEHHYKHHKRPKSWIEQLGDIFD